jgi:hypothetical protein
MELPALILELARVLAALPRIEARLRVEGPRPLVARLRRRRSPRRLPAARARLRKAIRWVDARLPGGASCWRRALLEVALDRGAASEAVLLGVLASSEPRSGHCWLESDTEDPRRLERYDAVFRL